jgi:hypothetical protein
VAIRITEIHRNGRFRLVSVTEIHRSPYRGPEGFGRSASVINSLPDNGLGHEHMAAMDFLSWHSQQPAAPVLSDEELAHAYFAAP